MRRVRVEIYRDGLGEWRWRLLASNGRIIADSGEGYTRLASVHRAVRCVRTTFTKCELSIEVLR